MIYLYFERFQNWLATREGVSDARPRGGRITGCAIGILDPVIAHAHPAPWRPSSIISNPDIPPDWSRVHDARCRRDDGDTRRLRQRLVDDSAACAIEIVRWPAQVAARSIVDTGTEGGTTEGTFISEWRETSSYGRNDAVGGHYILAYAGAILRLADDGHDRDPRRILLWHASATIRTAASSSSRSSAKPFLVPLARAR